MDGADRVGVLEKMREGMGRGKSKSKGGEREKERGDRDSGVQTSSKQM